METTNIKVKIIKNLKKNIIIKIGGVVLLILYLIRFAIGITGIPGPYIGTSVRQIDISEENKNFDTIGLLSKLFNREKYEHIVPDFSIIGFSIDVKLPKSDINNTIISK